MGELTASVQRYIAADRESALRYQRQDRSESTKKNDRRMWQRFSNYLGAKDPWKATPDDVAAWCAHLADEDLSLSYIHGALSVLNYKYEYAGKGEEVGRFGSGTRPENPARSPVVKATMRGIRRSHSRPVRKMNPILLETLEKLIDLQPQNEAGLRNRAMLALAWGGACHAYELVNMDLGRTPDSTAYLDIEDEGLIISVRRRVSPRGQFNWQVIGVPERRSAPQYCPKRLMLSWLEACRPDQKIAFPVMRYGHSSQLERINRHSVIHLMRPGLEELGLDPLKFASRSLRYLCATWLLQEGIPMGRIMQHCGFRRPESLLEKVQAVSAIQLSPLSETAWCR